MLFPVKIDLVLNSVVKIQCVRPVSNGPCPLIVATGSGFVISEKRIITNAHVVVNHILLEVTKHGSPKKYKAQVKAIGRECDLAILMIQSEEFWKDTNPLEFGDIPPLEEYVAIIGYPGGIDRISIIKGVVSSRIKPMKSVGLRVTKLAGGAIEIDAAVKPGNSGGPVCIGNIVVGVVHARGRHSNNKGYAIPTSEVKHFITAVEKKEIV